MLENILQKSRYLAILTVVITLLCAVMLYVMTSISAVFAIYEALTTANWSATTVKVYAVTFLKLVDIFLICMGWGAFEFRQPCLGAFHGTEMQLA